MFFFHCVCELEPRTLHMLGRQTLPPHPFQPILQICVEFVSCNFDFFFFRVFVLLVILEFYTYKFMFLAKRNNFSPSFHMSLDIIFCVFLLIKCPDKDF